MAYSINVADNPILVQDGTIDTDSTDLTLIGKNYTGFGQAYNENLVKLLENFADSTPLNPIKGQLWYDTSVSKLKVYSGTAFVPVSSTTVAEQQPLNMGVGDMWYNTTTKQLNFWDGSSIILLGPTYSASQQKSGFAVYTVFDTLSQPHVITCIYNNGVLVGLFANEAFTLQDPTSLAGYSTDGVIAVGFNQGTIPNFRFNVKAVDSDKLDGRSAIDYFRTGRDNYTDHKIYIDSNDGLSVKIANLKIDSNNVILENTLSNQPITIRGKNGNTVENGIKLYPGNRSVAIGTADTPYQLNLYATAITPSNVTNKAYVDNAISATTIFLSLVIDGSTTNASIISILSAMTPADDHPDNTAARILCSLQNPSAQKTIRVYRVLNVNNTKSWVLSPSETVTI